MKQNTRHFKNCLGVFQGGGCKALAFVGAYREAVDHGVFFSGVAGTSSGAIIAALIAAGAAPDRLEAAVLDTDFNSFKKCPDPVPVPADAGWGRHILSLSIPKHRTVARFMTHLGLFSSAKIQEWLERNLKTLLGINKSGQVRFKDLNIPLHVVATDLRGAKPIVWSTETTPDASVAYAVRCSCTIPIYFQAVDSVYVDGGIVSSLPSFVLNGRQFGNFEKLLCFTFAPSQDTSEVVTDGAISQPTPERSQRIERYLRNLISAVIDGAVHIQTELQANLHMIEISGLSLGTLDFDKVNNESAKIMFGAGKHAAELFFEAESTHIRTTGSPRSVLTTEAEALNQIVREEMVCGDEVLVALKSTRYVYNLFPTLLHWRMSDANLIFLSEPIKAGGQSASHESFRRLVLRALGVQFAEIPSLPLEAIFFKKQQQLGDMIVFDEKRAEEQPACFGVRYEKTYDSAAISSMYSELYRYIPASPPCSRTSVEIQKGSVDELFRRLRTVTQYANNRVTLSLEEVDVDKIVFLTKYVKSYKYNQIQRLFDIYEARQIELFESVQVRYSGPTLDVVMPITPPVAEEHGGKLYLFEGNSRLTYLIKEQNAKRVKLVVARGVEAGFPTAGRIRPEQLLISDAGKTGRDRYEQFNYSLFRSIEEAVRHPDLYKEHFSG